MNWSDLQPGDIVAKTPLGKYPLWMYHRTIGTRLAVYMCMEEGTFIESDRSQGVPIEPDWIVFRGGRVIKEAT